MAKKEIVINKLTKQELKKYIRNNVNYVNSTLTDIEKANKEYAPAYRYIIDKYSPKHKDLFIVKNGKIRFKSRDIDIENLSQSQLKQFSSVLKDYKEAKTSSLYKIKKVEDKVFNSFNSSNKTSLSREDFEKVVQNLDLSSFNTGKLSSSAVVRFIENVGYDVAMETLLNNSDTGTLTSLYNRSKDYGADFTSDELTEYLKEG